MIAFAGVKIFDLSQRFLPLSLLEFYPLPLFLSHDGERKAGVAGCTYRS